MTENLTRQPKGIGSLSPTAAPRASTRRAPAKVSKRPEGSETLRLILASLEDMKPFAHRPSRRAETNSSEAPRSLGWRQDVARRVG